MKYIILILIVLSGCSSDKTRTFIFEGPDVEKYTISKLKENKIWYKKLESGEYEIFNKDRETVNKFYLEALKDKLDPNYSGAFLLGMHEIMVKNFDRYNVKYEIRDYFGKKFIIWEKGQDEKVKIAEMNAEEEFLNYKVMNKNEP